MLYKHQVFIELNTRISSAKIYVSMATLVFCIFNFQGELNGSLNLAKRLKRLGHRVYYLGLADTRENVESHGFEFLTILENWFPVGFFTELDFSKNNQNKFNLLMKRMFFVRKLQRFINSLVCGGNKEIHSAIQQVNPDLLILSTTEGAYATFLGVIAYECKIKSIYLTDMFPSLPNYENKEDRYIESDKDTNFSLQNLFNAIIKRFLSLSGMDIDYKEAIREMSLKAGIPPVKLDLSRNAPLVLPHLFLCPKELELPNIIRENCCYAESSIDRSREQDFNFNWSKINKNKKIIYCSIGTTSGTFEALGIRKVKQFFQSVIDCISSSLKDEYQLIISVGGHIRAELLSFLSATDDVIIQERVPQLALLEKSSLAIIAGGIHTVKECIFFGVPMIVFPIWADQFDNAERVKHHCLGLIGDIESISSDYVEKLVCALKNNLAIYKNIDLWKQKFREIESSDRATQFVLETIGSRV
jgi:zeaxanthin glucosyltransferase